MFIKTITNYPNYKITDTGLVISVNKNSFLKASPNKQVLYLQVSLWKENKGTSFYVHRLVAEAFVPNPLNLPEVNHKDGNKHNNNASNLEWVTSQGNSVHAVSTGLKTYTNRLSDKEFSDCLDDVINGESYYSLSLRIPYKVPFISVKLRKLAKKLGKEDLLDKSLKAQKIARNRKVLNKINSK